MAAPEARATMELVQAKFGKRAPDGLASDLRALADAVDRGDVKELVACFVQNNEFNYLWAASLYDSLALSDLLHAQALHRMRE